MELNIKSYFNKWVFLIGLIIAVIINFSLFYTYGYITSNIKPIEKLKQPKVKFIEIKEKKVEKKKEKIVKERKYKKQENKVKAPKVSKSSGKIKDKKPVVPIAIPILPETVQLEEKKITIPENEENIASISENNVKIGDLKVYKPVLEGNFNPSFGTKLNKFDETAFGPAAGRVIVYKPETPVIKTALPPPSKIKVKLWINPDGTVDKVDIIYPKTLGDIKLKNIIESYVLSWKFNAISSDKKQWAVTTIKFKVEK
ncbi:hypothetical protein [Hydrogenothermus marinus]|uniref:Protein TonB n=1 Tax=Hydrogenothermus marinus TaxID=133270 RepID=A0A3M0BL79_9AQUI|nr:hypothetical protein [Hydrogenothermus marinus]RMA97194.1 protein TonB [Hydrogenothermus marinus]